MENRAKGYGEICEVLYEFENSVNLFLERASEIEKGDSDNEIKIMAMKKHAYGKIREKIAEIDDSFKAKKGLLEEVLQKIGLPLRRHHKSEVISPPSEE